MLKNRYIYTQIEHKYSEIIVVLQSIYALSEYDESEKEGY